MSIRVLLSRVLELVFRGRREDRLAEEIQLHLDQLTDDYAARGLSREEARLAARRAFGGIEPMKDAYRDQRGLPFADALVQDVRFAVRLLRRDRAFALAAVVVLGIGIGVNNMLFMILNAHTIRGLPIDRVDRVVYVSTFDDRTPDRGLSYPDYEDLRAAARGVVSLAAFSSAPLVVAGDGHLPERFEGAYVSSNAFALLGAEPVLGRGFSVDEDRPGAAAVAILGGGTWASRYGADRAILGRSIVVNGAATTVVGVMPERSGFPSGAEVWLPLGQMPGLAAQARDARTLRVVGRVQDGVALAEARSTIESITERSSRDHPETSRNVRARVVPINERFLGRLTDPSWMAFATVAVIIVLISCANVANLVLASSVRRAREIAIRSALGASRRRVFRQLLVEGAALAAAGGAVGLGIALAGVRLFRSAIPENVLPYWFDYSLDARVVIALVAVSASTVCLFAVLPALRASKADVIGVLKESGHAGKSARGTQRWATAFLAAEFGLAVLMLAHLTMTLRSSAPDVASDAAIDSRRVLTAVVTLPRETYPSPAQRSEFYRRLDERLRAKPDVSAISAASVLPLYGGGEERLDIEGQPQTGGEPGPTVRTVQIAPRYFETLGMTLTRGRDFADADGAPGHEQAIVNQRLAEQFFAGQDPVGRRISFTPAAASTPRTWLTIVGIAPDIRQRPNPEAESLVYVPLRAASPSSASLLVRTRGDAADLAPLLRKEVEALDPHLPLYRIRTMAQAVRDAGWNGRLAATLIRVLTLIAVALTTVGLYAVTAYGVSQRAHELGLRVALGARRRQIAAVVARRVLAQLTAGFLFGVLCTMLWNRTLPSAGLEVTDPVSLAIVAAILAGVAVIACAVPIHRATRVDPLVALRVQ